MAPGIAFEKTGKIDPIINKRRKRKKKSEDRAPVL